MKTVKEWLETLPEPYRRQALENLDNHPFMPNEMCSTMMDALHYGFLWQNTRQGHVYWADAYNGDYVNLTTPRQQADDLLSEFKERFNASYQSPMPIRDEDIQDFLTHKFGL